jgi:hypothetical protein
MKYRGEKACDKRQQRNNNINNSTLTVTILWNSNLLEGIIMQELAIMHYSEPA